MSLRVEPERPVNPLFPRTRQINLLHKRYAIQQKIVNRRVKLPDSLDVKRTKTQFTEHYVKSMFNNK